MADYITLLGAESVQRAGCSISAAAERMERAAGEMNAAIDRMERILEHDRECRVADMEKYHVVRS